MSSVGRVSGQPTLRNSGLALWVRVGRDRARCEGIGNYIGPGIIAGAIASNSARTLEVGDIAGHDQTVRLAGPGLEDVVCLPVTENPRRWPAPKPSLALPRGLLIDGSPRNKMFDVIPGDATSGTQVKIVLHA